MSKILFPARDFTVTPHIIIIRSLDVNKPGAEIDDLKGDVDGGSILTGILRLGNGIEARPGIVIRTEKGQVQ